MLKTILKHDFRAFFKYWWIGALVTFVLSILAGLGIHMISTSYHVPPVLDVLAVLSIVIVIISYIVFGFLSAILVYVRYYKNFFTDEGYLTFTLPVKRSHLLISKLIAGVTAMISTTLIIIIDASILIAAALASEFSSDFITFNIPTSQLDSAVPAGYLCLYILEVLLTAIVSVTITILFVYFCITFASLISRKGKVLIAIAIYYVVNGIITTAIQIFSSIAITGISDYMYSMTSDTRLVFLALIGLGWLLLTVLIAILLYALVYWMLDRKLNLS